MDQQDIKQAGLKITHPRTVILNLLQNTEKRHFSAEDIYQLLLENNEKMALTTIYRVLTQFEAAGLVIRHHFEGSQAVFELDEGDHHDHIVNISTGKIVEFYDEVIEQRQREIAIEHGYRLLDHSMILYCKPEEDDN